MVVSSCDQFTDLRIPESQSVRTKNRILSSIANHHHIFGKPLVLIVRDSRDSSSKIITQNMRWALKYTKIPSVVVNVRNLRNYDIPSSVKLLCYTPTSGAMLKMAAIKKMIRFVATGHNMIMTSTIWNPRMSYLQGLKPGINYTSNNTAKGYHFKMAALPGFNEKTLNHAGMSIHGGMKGVDFKKSLKILATAGNDSHYPVILEHKIGDGHVLIYNTGELATKEYRGLIFSSMIRYLPGIPYLTANVSTIFIDDFPQPLYYDISPPIKKEYGVSDVHFETKIWWPDMVKLSHEFNIKYTCMLVFNYNNELTPPFDFKQWSYAKININGKRVQATPYMLHQSQKQGYEIGYHGYNHISLLTKNWKESNMIISIRDARKMWKLQHAGSFPVTYVPPNDYIDSTGIQALIKGMPSIRYLCSTFEDSVATGNGREFGIDPYSSKIFDYPRVSSGYVDDNRSLYAQENVYIFTGIWTHFIHPDDVYDLPRYGGEGGFGARNIHGLGWHPYGKHKEGLYEVFRRRLKQSFEYNPLLRIETAHKAIPIVERWRNSNVTRMINHSTNEIHYQNSIVNSDTTLKYWFVFVPKSENSTYQKLIKNQSKKYAKVRLWDGYLYQFNTNRNTIYFPRHLSRSQKSIAHARAVANTVLHSYRKYMVVQNGTYGSGSSSNNSSSNNNVQSHAQLISYLEALKKHPHSLYLQNKVIKLAVADNRVDIAIQLLRRRLLTTDKWKHWDIDLLLRYNSWQNNDKSIWPFLKERWKRFPDEYSVRLEQYVVRKLGVPNDQFYKKWLQRAIKLNPQDYSTKSNYASYFQSKQDWPVTKKYLLQLIHHHPKSDTLYRYTFQHSTWYDKADTTIKLLNSFPKYSFKQLAPYDAEIANLYAYNANNMTKAIQWAERDPNYDQRTILNWLLTQKRYADFKTRSTRLLRQHPNNDSLRVFIGLSYLENGYSNLAYRTLNPMIRRNNVSPSFKKQLNADITGMTYEKRKKLYLNHPQLFLPKTKQNFLYEHRIEEGVEPGIVVSYSTDNFKNRLASTVLSTSWGERLKYINTVSTGFYYVSSDINNQPLHSSLQEINYKYQHYFDNQKYEVSGGAGVSMLPNYATLPANISAGIAMSGNMNYTSLTLDYLPVYTSYAVKNRYYKMNGSLYNEFYLFARHLETSQTITANQYSNSVTSYEFDGHLYFIPNPKQYFNIDPEVMYSYSSATKNYASGIPYWTPHNLQIEGAGFMWKYNKDVVIPQFSMNGEALLQNDNQNGLYFTSNISLNIKIHKYWQVSLEGDFSTSRVYRSNEISLSVSYYLPKKLY